LESGLGIPLEKIENQLKYLCETFGTSKINLRFGPIMFYTLDTAPNTILDNLSGFETLCILAKKYSIPNIKVGFFICSDKSKILMNSRGKNIILATNEMLQESITSMKSTCSKYSIFLDTNQRSECFSNNIIIPEHYLKMGSCDCHSHIDICSGKDKSCRFSCDYCQFGTNLPDTPYKDGSYKDIEDIYVVV